MDVVYLQLSDWTYLQWACAASTHSGWVFILCHEGWQCGSSKMTLGRTCYYYHTDKICFNTCRHRHEIQEEEQEWHGYSPSCSGVQAEQVSRSHCAAVTSGSRPDPHPVNVVQTEDWAGAPAALWGFRRSPDTAVQASRPAAQCSVPISW